MSCLHSTKRLQQCCKVCLFDPSHPCLCRKSCSCPGTRFICWVTVWEHMRLELLGPSQIIKSAGSQVRSPLKMCWMEMLSPLPWGSTYKSFQMPLSLWIPIYICVNESRPALNGWAPFLPVLFLKTTMRRTTETEAISCYIPGLHCSCECCWTSGCQLVGPIPFFLVPVKFIQLWNLSLTCLELWYVQCDLRTPRQSHMKWQSVFLLLLSCGAFEHDSTYVVPILH